VILNLLNNSVDALCSKKIQKPLIEISVKERDQTIVLEIVDNAKGIPKEIIDKIFDPYFTTKDKGTGLGLYMSKIIIESHMKGRLSLKNTKEGSLFTIELTKD
jgi:nitrogen fixation/metabolism regulation signal transduction histidine kinase